MLIDKGLSEGDIITIKLTSGEELVARLVEENDSAIKLQRPMVLTAGKDGLMMVPYLFTVDPLRQVKIYKSTVTVMEPTEQNAAKRFVEATTGIVT